MNRYKINCWWDIRRRHFKESGFELTDIFLIFFSCSNLWWFFISDASLYTGTYFYFEIVEHGRFYEGGERTNYLFQVADISVIFYILLEIYFYRQKTSVSLRLSGNLSIALIVGGCCYKILYIDCLSGFITIVLIDNQVCNRYKVLFNLHSITFFLILDNKFIFSPSLCTSICWSFSCFQF